MAGRRDGNLRGGDLAEGLGTEMLRPFAAVTPVPRTEDVGIDVIATLLRRQGRMLYAGDSFAVQIKASSVRNIAYDEDEYRWMRGLRLPFFVLSVDLKTTRASLHSTHRLQLMPTAEGARAATLYLDSRNGWADSDDDHDHSPTVRDGVLHMYLGEPVLSWTPLDAADDVFVAKASDVLREWMRLAHRNLLTCAAGGYTVPGWRTNELPREQYWLKCGAVDRQEALAFAAPLLEPVLMAVAAESEASRHAVRSFVEAVRRCGVDPDPQNLTVLRMPVLPPDP
jgi:hypothetical protein